MEEVYRWILFVVGIGILYYFLFFRRKRNKKDELKFSVKDAIGYVVVVIAFHVLLIILYGFTGSVDLSWTIVVVAFAALVIYRNRSRIKKFMKKK